MNVKTITIDNRDLPYSIDTYAMFTGEHTADSEIDWLLEQHPGLNKLLTDNGGDLEIGFNYNHKEIVKELASSSIAIIEQELHYEKPQVIKGMPVIKKTGSPQFYNYTTDWYVADWAIDLDALKQVTPNDWRKQAVDTLEWDANDLDDPDKAVVAQLALYLSSVLSEDDYNSRMWELESDHYLNNMTPDADTQAAIDKLKTEAN